jgi:hypothetical protein
MLKSLLPQNYVLDWMDPNFHEKDNAMKLLSKIYEEAVEKSRVDHPTKNWDLLYCDDNRLSSLLGKKVSGPRSTGVISKIHFESLREDRYTSINIDWDHGGKSFMLFMVNGDSIHVYGV